MEPNDSLPHSQQPAWGLRVWLVTRFYDEELSAPRTIPILEDHPLSAVRDCLFNIFAATLHIWRPFLHPQPEDAPCRGDRDPLVTVTGTHLSLWQGPTCHCDRDPYITVYTCNSVFNFIVLNTLTFIFLLIWFLYICVLLLVLCVFFRIISWGRNGQWTE
jgi:hypothetical protein